MNTRSDTASGLSFGLAATLLWGSYPLWYKPLSSVGSYQLLCWRVVFAEFFLLALVLISGRMKLFGNTLKSVKLSNILTISCVLGFWWLLYIYGILTGRVLEVAFGYFLSPVMSIFVSRLIFKEALTKYGTAAVLLALTGVAIMAVELLSLRSFPWIAIVIGFCYSFYGIFKKRVSGDPIVVQSLEIGVMLPLAALFLLFNGIQGQSYTFQEKPGMDVLLIATGLITVLPLWWYSRAARQLPMMTLGFLQFIPPTCNFLLATLVYEEAVSPLKLLAFFLIWLALAVFTWDSLNKHRLASKRLQSVSDTKEK